MFTFTPKEKLLQMSIQQSLTTPVNLATYFYISNVFFQFFNVTLYIALKRPNCPMTYKIIHEMSHNQTKNKI